jgi:hypothetical protein
MPEPTHSAPASPNRAARRTEARRARKLAAVGSGVVLATSMAGMAVSSAPAGADTRVVTNLNDAGPGSLRDALANANDGDVIDLTGLSGTITLTTGQLNIDDVVTIQGPGPGVLTISGNNASRVFNSRDALSGSGTVTISGLTITGGNATSEPSTQAGAGINFDCDRHSNNSLTVSNVVITGNLGSDLGGGLYFDRCLGDAALTIQDSVIATNVTNDSGGGGVWFDEGATMLVVNSTIAGNQADDGGGGITFDDGGQLIIRNSTIAGNKAQHGSGAGLYLSGNVSTGVTITNSTIANNTATDSGDANGGGIVAQTFFPMTILQSTISGNTTDNRGDGIYLAGYSEVPASTSAPRGNQDDDANKGAVHATAAQSLVLTGTIVAGNADGTQDIATGETDTADTTAKSSILGGLTSGITLTDQGGNQKNVTNPGLEALADNGGPTQTMALVAGSPAIDAGPDPVPDFPGNDNDQRGPGFPRVVNGKVDVGAFEVQPPPVPVQPNFTG